MEYFRTCFYDTEVTVRDIEEADVQTLVDYWHGSDSEYLRSLGVDVTKLVSQEETRNRFLSSVPPSQSDQRRATFIVASSEQIIGYTNLHIVSPEEVYAHIHILQKGIRSKGLAYVLFLEMLRIFFSCLPIEKLIFQTSPENKSLHRLIQRFGFTPTRAYLSNPDGMARAGEFHIYEISRESVKPTR